MQESADRIPFRQGWLTHVISDTHERLIRLTVRHAKTLVVDLKGQVMDVDEDHIAALLCQPSEGLQVELKTWLDPRTQAHKAKLVKAIFAIRNRNGGYLVIGFNDATCAPDRYSLSGDIEDLYHSDAIQGLVSRYASDLFEVVVEFAERDGQQHPIVVVPDGVQVPVIVKKDLTLDGGKKLLRRGEIYFRTLQANGTPSSARLLPVDYPDLLDICFDNREADIGRFLRRHLPGVDGRAVETLLATRGADLMQRLRDRAFASMDEGASAFDVAVEMRDIASGLEWAKDALTMRVGLALDPPKPEGLATNEFMNRVSASNPRYTGWPVWLDTRYFPNLADRAGVLDGVWQALIVNLGEDWSYQDFEFLRFDPKGEFYLQRVMQDDLSPKVRRGTAMDTVLMIYRVGETLAVGLSMARELDWETDGTANFAFMWTGLKGRKLSAWASPWGSMSGDGAESQSSAAKSFVQVPLETPHAALAPYVGKAVGPLFALFNGYEAPGNLVETCVQKMTQRKMGA